MARLLILALIVGALFTLTVGVTSANGGPHGGFTATTDSCAGCHRNHTAAAPGLLLTQNATLCRTCHGATGTGANTNVDDGVYLSTRGGSGGVTPANASLMAGGFVNYKAAAATSAHSVTSTDTQSWGYGTSTPRGLKFAISSGLDCASCHDAHGNTNYRILKTNLNGTAVAVAQVDEGANKNYSVEAWGTGQSQFCAGCHTTYHRTAAGQGGLLDLGNYTHRVDMSYSFGGNVNPQTGWTSGGVVYRLPLANIGGVDDKVVCGTCHVAHGTSATMTGYAAGTFDPFGAGAPGPVPSADSALLRMNNRGVCQVCHQK